MSNFYDSLKFDSMVAVNYDLVPVHFINKILTEQQKERVAIKYFIYQRIKSDEELLPQFKSVSQELLEMGYNYSMSAIRQFYYSSKD